MNKRLTKRFIIKDMTNLKLSYPIRYERYYINDNLRIQKKKNIYEKEILDNNVVVQKVEIDIGEFERLKTLSYKKIIRDSYLYLNDERVSIKKYYDIYESLMRVEVKFDNEDDMASYKKEEWFGKEITQSLLAFDKDLSKLNREKFLEEINKYI